MTRGSSYSSLLKTTSKLSTSIYGISHFNEPIIVSLYSSPHFDVVIFSISSLGILLLSGLHPDNNEVKIPPKNNIFLN